MRLIDIFEYIRLKDWDNSTDVRMYKKYVHNKPKDEGDTVSEEVNVSICFTDEDGVRQCYNTVYFQGVPCLASNFDMKAMYVAIKEEGKENKYYNQIQFTEKYDNFVIFEPLPDGIPFDAEGKSANDLELNVIDRKIFEDEEGYDTDYIFAFKNIEPSELLNLILLT